MQAGASPGIEDLSGRTALHWAAGAGRTDGLKLLLLADLSLVGTEMMLWA